METTSQQVESAPQRTSDSAPQSAFVGGTLPYSILGTVTPNMPPLNPNQILQLQRAIGNQASIRLLNNHRTAIQRTISDVQLQRALQYYQDHASEYSGVLIRRVQAHFGVRISGTMNAETVQAIAGWQTQRERSDAPPTMVLPDSRVDGILSPAEMFDIVGTGLERREEREAYVESTTAIGDQWASLTPARRLELLRAQLNQRLEAIGVPQCQITSDGDLPSQVLAEFTSRNWSIHINESILQDAEMSVDLVSTLYHEARHAEQWWLAIRWMIQSRRMVEGITTSFALPLNEPDLTFENIPDEIISQARSSAVLAGDERQMGRMMAWTFFESPTASDQNPEFMTPLTRAFCDAQRAHRENPSPETERRIEEARQAWEEGHALYVDWWHEQDTHQLQGVISGEYSEANPDAPHREPDVCESLEE